MRSQGSGKPAIVDGLTIEVLMKIKTNFKLNLKSSVEGEDKLIPRSKELEDEIHFVKFEGFYPSFELTLEAMSGAVKNKEFKDWTIVDFDYFLKGNPHI